MLEILAPSRISNEALMSICHQSIVVYMRDLTDKRFGRWTVLSFSHRKETSYYWNCICDCGTERAIRLVNKGGRNSQSCGCARAKHGQSDSKIYNVWASMKGRCLNSAHKFYPFYGGRGIAVCQRWISSFADFASDMGDRPKGGTIDRIDNGGNYSPENCRWSTMLEQGNNRRNNTRLTFKGRTQTISQWQRELGFKPTLINNRLRIGWSVERALSEPVN